MLAAEMLTCTVFFLKFGHRITSLSLNKRDHHIKRRLYICLIIGSMDSGHESSLKEIVASESF